MQRAASGSLSRPVTSNVVIDASVAIALVRAEPISDAVDARIRSWRIDGKEIVVPGEFWLEVTNVLLRRYRQPGRAVVAALHQLDDLGLQTIDIDRPLVLLIVDRAERHGLTSYDATYLALAEMLDADLFTNDQALLDAAGARGVSPLGNRHLSERPATYESEATWARYRDISAFLARLRAEARSTTAEAPRR
jgi:predicted nucleic acid-binding protein